MTTLRSTTRDEPAPDEGSVQADRVPAPEATVRRRGLRRPGEWVLFCVLVIGVGGLVLPPLVVMLWKSLVPGGLSLDGEVSLDAYRDVISSESFVETLRSTTIFVALSTLLAMVVALGIAWLVVRTDARWKGLAYAGIFLGIATPGIVSAIGWLLLFGGDAGFANRILADLGLPGLNVSTMTGMVVVEALRLVPMSFLFMIGPLRSMNISLEEAGLMCGAGPRTVLRRITGPVLLPALLGSSFLSLIWAIQAFEIPLVLGSSAGIPIFTAEIYEGLHNSMTPDYAIAAAYGAILVVAVALLIRLESRVLRQAERYQVVTGKVRSSHVRSLGPWRWVAGAGFAMFLAANLLPVAYTLLASFSPRVGAPFSWDTLTTQNYAELLDYRGFDEAVRNSLLIALAAAVVVVIMTFVIGRYVTGRHTTFRARFLEQLTCVPLVIPTVVLSLGFLLFFLSAPVSVYGTIWIIVIAYVAHYLPYGLRYLKPALMSIGQELEEAARMSGATEASSARRIMFPLVRPAALGVGTYIFSLAFRELSLPALIVTAGSPLVSTMLLGAIANGDLNVVGAMGTVMMTISLVIGGLAYKLLGNIGQGMGETR